MLHELSLAFPFKTLIVLVSAFPRFPYVTSFLVFQM